MPDHIEDRRRNRRRKVKSGASVSCRRGAMGLGPDLAVRLQDICEDGLQLLLKAPVAAREEVEVSFTPPGVSRAFTRMAEVVRCLPLEDGSFQVGVRFRGMLGYSDICHLF
jgi:hypothetical protein